MSCLAGLLLAACAAARPAVAPAAAPTPERDAPPAIVARRPLAPQSIADAGGELLADLIEVRLDLVLDHGRRSLHGRAENTFRGLRASVASLALHGRGLSITSVRDGKNRELDWHQDGERIVVELREPLLCGGEERLVVEYSARPERGLWFVEAPDGSPEIWSQNEPSDARAWIPTWDEPNDRTRFDARITVEAGLDVLSNGVRQGIVDNPDGTRTFHWLQERPIPSYLFAIAAGRWVRIVIDECQPSLGFYAPSGTPQERVERAFRETLAMLAFESERFGQDFPWPRYDQVCVDGFVMAGMENAGMTLLTSDILHDDQEELDEFGERRLLLAHEAAHQWFGDLVTCLGWRNLWLNEAWASFVELAWEAERGGAPSAALWYERYREQYLARGEQTRLPLAESWHAQASQELCNHEYDKGPWVLRMLEHELGTQDFWCGVRHYLAAHADGFVTTEDFGRAFLDATGRNVFPFLQQWVEGAGHPVLRASFVERGGRIVLSLAQRQHCDELVPLFDVPLEVELDFADGRSQRETLRVREAQAEFDLGPSAPGLVDVVLDPEGFLLCEIEFEKSGAAWAHQAGLASSPAARWRAVAPLASRAHSDADADERRAAEQALGRLLHAEHFLLRARAAAAAVESAALRADVLRVACEDPVAHVREVAVRSLARDAATPEELEPLRARLAQERSPRVRLALERALGVLDAPTPP